MKKVFLLPLISLLWTSCAYFEAQDPNILIKQKEKRLESVRKPTERELLFAQAEKLYEAGSFDEALSLYFKIAREPADLGDSIYDTSLMRLARLYEKSDQSEKAILALNELETRKSDVMSKAALRIALMKNHYRLTNYYQAKLIKADLDRDYKARLIDMNELYQAIYYQTDFYYDRHIFDEISFLGDIQKYFVYVVESNSDEEAERLADLLVLYYRNFIKQLDNQLLSSSIKKKLIVEVLDQLARFDQYKIVDKQSPASLQLNKFSKFAERTKASLTERLANEKF